MKVSQQSFSLAPRAGREPERGAPHSRSVPHRATVLLTVLAALFFCSPAFADTPSPGEKLAERIRSAEPDENSQVRGTLITHHKSEVTEIPVVCRVALKGATWETEYQTMPTAGTGSEWLKIIHSTNGPNQYFFAHAAAPDASLGKPLSVPPEDTAVSFAGSAFTLGDLGLEFLHWPQQKQLPDQTRLSRACYVLESSNPNAQGGVVRVLSYIDQETAGLLIARAYDANGKLVKQFSLHGSSFKKVNGHWHLEKMDLHDYKANLQTEWKFDITE